MRIIEEASKHGVIEMLKDDFNNKINAIKRKAYRFRDWEYFKLKILQSCGLRHRQIREEPSYLKWHDLLDVTIIVSIKSKIVTKTVTQRKI